MTRYYAAPMEGDVKTAYDKIRQESNAFRAATLKLGEKYGFTRCFPSSEDGSVRAVLFDKKETPDPKFWKKYKREGYAPKRTKAAKEVHDEFTTLPKVNWKQLWQVINWTEWYFGENLAYFHPKFQVVEDGKTALFWTNEPGQWKPTPNLRSITWDEWKALLGNEEVDDDELP